MPLNMWGDHYLLSRICLHRQFRIAADDATIRWIDDFADGKRIGRIPQDIGEKNRETGELLRSAWGSHLKSEYSIRRLNCLKP